MNISELAKAINISTDTVRYYERLGILSSPPRQGNGYRIYTEAHIELLRFVRGAQALGFSLAEIQKTLPQFTDGRFGTRYIEQQISDKLAQIDVHILQLKTLKRELKSVLKSVTGATNQCFCTADEIPSHLIGGAAVGMTCNTFSPLVKNKRA